ncbi:MAG: hypothetical protein JWM11_4145 [Planctomycetaceae bacterium]|nr:hypothetical protein [Planctomycetaceae bacterium]
MVKVTHLLSQASRCRSMLRLLIVLATFLLPESIRSEEPAKLALPIVGLGDTASEHIASIVANRPQRKLYVGVLSRDAARTGLQVFDLRDDGQFVGKPRLYSDHPDELPAGHHSTPVCLLHDARHQKLFLGVHGSHPTHARSLVMYSLDDRGEPVGRPQAFDHGNPNKSCDALELHPANDRLYAVGWGGEGVYILNRDEQGRPVGKPLFHRTGNYGAHAVAIRADGTKLYRGTYPATIEVCDLNPQGDLVGSVRSTVIPNGPLEYQRFVVTDRALYFRGPDRRLSWFTLNESGEISGTMKSADIPNLQGVAAAPAPGHLLVAVASGFDDAITGKNVVNGVEIREVVLQKDGAPGSTVRQSDPYLRAEVVSMSGGSGAALAAKSLGRGFLGNRLAGLKVRCSLVSLELDGAPFPAVSTVKMGDQPEYLRFVASATHSRIYAIVNEKIVSYQLGNDPKSIEILPRSGAVGNLAFDAARNRLFVALKDGTIAVHAVNEQGVPLPAAETLATSLASIGTLAIHARTGLVYAIGVPEGKPRETPGVVAVPAGSWISDAVIDADHGRLYVVGAYHGLQNTSVWKLDAQGKLSANEPTWLADGIPVDKPEIRGILSSVRVDPARRKLYVTGGQENPTTQSGYLIVRDLDEHGDAIGAPRLYPSANRRGSRLSLDISPDGKWLYESGWGEPLIFVRRLNPEGEPARESTAWPVGSQGKQQLQVLSHNGKEHLLAGTHPSVLEVIPLRAPNEPEPGAIAEFGAESLQVKLGMLSAGQTSQWIDLDPALQNGVGMSVARCTLNGGKVKRAVLRWEVARQVGDKLEAVRSANVSLAGNVGALILPKYGMDDRSQLASQVKTSAEEFARYREFARKYSVSAGERPRELLVANGLIGLDSSDEALEAGMATLAMLGHNAAQIWNWPGVAPETIRAAADRHGIGRFREAVYNPPSYFHYNVDQVQPEFLDKWASGFRDAAAQMGAKPHELELLHMGDEPGWYFPAVTNEVRNDPRRLAVFRDYLKSKGLTPQSVGAASWDQVFPGSLSTAQALPQRKLFYWTTRFYAESLSLAFAAATQSLQRQVNPKLLTTTNLNNWPGRFYIPSPGVKLANNSDAGPDAGMGMPDWFDLGRKRAISCIWTEDWFSDGDAQLWSMYGDLLRCAAREGGIEYGGYPVGQSTGAMPDGAKLKIAALVGHGAKAIDPYIFGPNLAFGDGWSEKEVTYRNLGSAIRMIGKADRLLAPGRPRDGSVAIVFPQASQVWDADSKVNCYQQELYGLHAALIHENYAVDFVDDMALEAGDLKRRKYSTIYVTAPNLSLAAQRALREWSEAGGTLVLSPGACAADEYNEAASELRSLIGATQPTVARVAPPHYSQAFRVERVPVEIRQSDNTKQDAFAISQVVPLKATSAKSVATFADGTVAMTEATLSKGRIVALGFWPGVSYWLSPDRTDPTRLPTQWAASVRQLISRPALQANAWRHVLVSEPGVEACLLESKAGLAITVLNWTGKPIPQLQITIPAVTDVRRVSSVEQGPREFQLRSHGLEVHLPVNAADILLIETGR